MGTDVRIKPALELRSRIRVLYDVVRELAEGFGVKESDIETIRKGVLERQILKRIVINYLNADGKLIGRVTITIDWQKHAVLAHSENGKSFDIDPTKSIRDQISRIFSLLVEHTERMRKAFHVTSIHLRYGYTDAVWADKKKLEEARKLLGTSPGEDYEWTEESPSAARVPYDVELEYISQRLAELKVRIEHNKPRK